MFPVFCFLILSGFLACLGLFALAVTKVAAPDGHGHARGFLGGLAALLSLFLLCGLGLTGLAATVVAIGIGSVADWNPIRNIEITRVPARPAPGCDSTRRESAVAARFTVHGEGGDELVGLVHELVDMDLGELGDGLTVQHQSDGAGGGFTVYEFRLPISQAELEHFERDVRVELDGLRLRLPERVDIEFDGAR